MNLSTEAQTHEAIKKWRESPPMAQVRNINQAIESLELSQMYYEQKDNDSGMKRTEKCIKLLQDRKKDLED